MSAKKIIVGMAVAASVAAAVFLLGNGNGAAGLFALQTQQGGKVAQVSEGAEAGISPQLSFEALCETKLEIKEVKTAIGRCPAYSQIVFIVGNAGDCGAER